MKKLLVTLFAVVLAVGGLFASKEFTTNYYMSPFPAEHPQGLDCNVYFPATLCDPGDGVQCKVFMGAPIFGFRYVTYKIDNYPCLSYKKPS